MFKVVRRSIWMVSITMLALASPVLWADEFEEDPVQQILDRFEQYNLSKADRIESIGYEIQSRLDELSANESELKRQVADVQEELDTSQQKISELQSRIPEEIAQINSHIKEEENAIAKYKAEIEKNTLGLKQKIKENETQLASEEREEEITRLRNNISALNKHIASGRYKKWELDGIDRCKKSIERYNKALSEGTYQWHGLYEGVGITINRVQDEIKENLDYIKTVTAESEGENKRLKDEIKRLKEAKSFIEGKRSEKPKEAEVQDNQSLLELWNQRGHVEEVTDAERLAAQKAYKEFIAAKAAEPKAADVFDVSYYKLQKKRVELKEELKQKFPDAEVPEERIDVAALLDDIGLDTIAEQLITPEDVEELEANFEISMEAIGDVGQAFVETGERFKDSFDAIFEDNILVDDKASIEKPDLVKGATVSQQVQDILGKSGWKDPSTLKGGVAKNVEKLLENKDSSFIDSTTIDAISSMMDDISKPWSEQVKKLFESKDDKAKASGDKKDAKPDEKSYERKVAEYLGGKTLDKGIDIAKTKMIEKAKEKFIAKYGEATFNKIDKVKGGYDKLLGWYNTGKEIYGIHKDMDAINQKVGKGSAVFYGSLKGGAMVIAKVAGGPAVTAVTTMLSAGADVTKAAVETGDKIHGHFGDKIPFRYDNAWFGPAPNIFLKKYGKLLDDDEGRKLTIGGKSYNVHSWKKYIRDDGEIYHYGYNADGGGSGIYIKIDKRTCLKFWGKDTVKIYDSKTHKLLKTIKMKL